MEMMHHAVNWFEIPVTDFNRAKIFYSSIYDYETPEMMMALIKSVSYYLTRSKEELAQLL